MSFNITYIKMDQQQTSYVPTPVSFDDISLDRLSFNDIFRVTRGSASQVVLGLRNMLQKLTTPENDYQKSIYPQLTTSINTLVDNYVNTFLNVTDVFDKQVFGANLNGFRNDGSLYRSVNSGINRSLTYGYSQFGQLVRVLVNRLKFIVKRDPKSVERYKTSENEMVSYQSLQQAAEKYLNVVTEVTDNWSKTVEEARNTHGVNRDNRDQQYQQNNSNQNTWTTVQRSSRQDQPKQYQPKQYQPTQYQSKQYQSKQYQPTYTTDTASNTTHTNTTHTNTRGGYMGRGGRGGNVQRGGYVARGGYMGRGGHGATHHNSNMNRTQQAQNIVN